jgi:hypothetical protein
MLGTARQRADRAASAGRLNQASHVVNRTGFSLNELAQDHSMKISSFCRRKRLMLPYRASVVALMKQLIAKRRVIGVANQ